MHWFEEVQRFREEKEASNRGEYTASACAMRAKVSPNYWGRLEAGLPRKKDGSPPGPTLHTVKTLAEGLQEHEDTIKKLVGMSVRDTDDDVTKTLMRRIGRKMHRLPPDKREKVLSLLEGDAEKYVSLLCA